MSSFTPTLSAEGPTSESSDSERQARFDLAVICRVSDRMGLSDCCGGFSAARVPGEDALVIRGQSQDPGQVTPSSLFRRDLDERPVWEKNHRVNGDALQMAQRIFAARPDVGAIMHGHTPVSMVFSALDVELLPISQFGTMFWRKMARTGPLQTVGTNHWCDQMVERLAGNPALLFTNHGIVVVGRDCKQAMHNFYALEQAMQIQIEATKTGAEIQMLSDSEAEKLQQHYWGGDVTTDYDGSREWESWVQMVVSEQPSFS